MPTKRVVAAVLQRPDGKILLLRRNQHRRFEPGRWGVVSGHQVRGETPYEAVKREVTEEVGLVLNGLANRVGFPVLVHDQGRELIITPFLFHISSRIASSLKVDPAEHDDWQWCDPSELGSLPLVSQLREDLVALALVKPKKIIGLVGKNGAGKDTVVNYLRDRYGYQTLNISDLVRALATKENLALTRENLHAVSARYLSQHGGSYFSDQAVITMVQAGWQRVAVSGIRTVSNVATFREYFGREFYLINVVVSDDKIRFQRLLKRRERKDPQTWAEFIKQETAEEKLFQISQTEQAAQLTLFNDGSLKQLFSQLDEVMENWDESPMTL
ncbi:MAG TPA: NUDIX domain-containing protein [Vitreimonas sp.]|nr:NUDIX domain-containing protein [Vitreimonas sp.]